jgi:hypothetical protein
MDTFFVRKDKIQIKYYTYNIVSYLYIYKMIISTILNLITRLTATMYYVIAPPLTNSTHLLHYTDQFGGLK